MQSKRISLDFGIFELEAELFDNAVANRFAANLPYQVPLQQWGDEVYGDIGIDHGAENPIPEIPPGGIAYTNNGNYLCIFYGQTPAWSVEYIGQIRGDEWKKLLGAFPLESVTVRLK